MKARKDGRTSPFVTMWFVQMNQLNASVVQKFQRLTKKKTRAFRLFSDLDELPDGIFLD